MIWKRVGLGIRLSAAAIDTMIVVAAGLALRLTLGDAGLLCGAFVALAYPLAEVMTAHSPGKWLLGLEVRDADSTPASRRQLTRRVVRRYAPNIIWAGMLLAGLITATAAVASACIALLSIVAAAEVCRKDFRASRRFGWDVMARTAVLGRTSGGAGHSTNQPARQTSTTRRAA
jgi:hypothetical protein